MPSSTATFDTTATCTADRKPCATDAAAATWCPVPPVRYTTPPTGPHETDETAAARRVRRQHRGLGRLHHAAGVAARPCTGAADDPVARVFGATGAVRKQGHRSQSDARLPWIICRYGSTCAGTARPARCRRPADRWPHWRRRGLSASAGTRRGVLGPARGQRRTCLIGRLYLRTEVSCQARLRCRLAPAAALASHGSGRAAAAAQQPAGPQDNCNDLVTGAVNIDPPRCMRSGPGAARCAAAGFLLS